MYCQIVVVYLYLHYCKQLGGMSGILPSKAVTKLTYYYL